MVRTAIVLIVVLALAVPLAFACSDDDEPSADEPTATAPPLETPSPQATDSTEGGRDPIYWRTLDNFRTVREGEPYKVVLRVTNGYTEDVLPIEAATTTGAGALTFEAMRVDAPGEGKGTFYTVNLEFPRQGRYEVTFTAGDDAVSTEINVLTGAGPTG